MLICCVSIQSVFFVLHVKTRVAVCSHGVGVVRLEEKLRRDLTAESVKTNRALTRFTVPLIQVH